MLILMLILILVLLPSSEPFQIVSLISFHRFYHDGWWRKRQTYVDFLFSMDMCNFTPVRQQYRTYNLYGVSNHYGTMEGGHYTAYCKNRVYNNKWFKFDDHEVSEISSSDVSSGNAYILFYAAVEYKVPGSKG